MALIVSLLALWGCIAFALLGLLLIFFDKPGLRNWFRCWVVRPRNELTTAVLTGTDEGLEWFWLKRVKLMGVLIFLAGLGGVFVMFFPKSVGDFPAGLIFWPIAMGGVILTFAFVLVYLLRRWIFL